MTAIDQLKERLPDYARDLRINLGVIASSTALTPAQAWTIALARRSRRGTRTSSPRSRPTRRRTSPRRSPLRKRRGRDHGHEQRLLPVPALHGRRVGVRPDAGAAAHAADRQPRHRQARLRARVPGGVGDHRLRDRASARTRRPCASAAARRSWCRTPYGSRPWSTASRSRCPKENSESLGAWAMHR